MRIEDKGTNICISVYFDSTEEDRLMLALRGFDVTPVNRDMTK